MYSGSPARMSAAPTAESRGCSAIVFPTSHVANAMKTIGVSG